MPAVMLSDRHKGLLGPRGVPENDGIGNWPSSEKSGCCGKRNFFLGGEKGDRWRIVGIFETISTSQGLTHFTFCNRSGSSHDTCKI